MYLWKVDSLVEDFKSGNVTQKEEFKYMLLFTIAGILVTNPALYTDVNYNHYDSIQSIVFVGISILGVYYCYKINSIGDNKDFIVRAMCISLPVLIRVSVVTFPVILVVMILESILLYPESIDEEIIENTPIQVVLWSIYGAAYYWYLSTKIKAVSSTNG